MGKEKQFIDKKKSATFQLMVRDSSHPNYSSASSGDQIFVRVDNNQYTPESFPNDGGTDGGDDSFFADADEDSGGEDANGAVVGSSSLLDHVRREILELGFPDDGYNYLAHMREIKNTGGGLAYYENPNATFDQLPRDVKAYDASKVEPSNVNDVSEEESIYSVASKTVGVRLQKVLESLKWLQLWMTMIRQSLIQILSTWKRILLSEDFVVRANLFEGPFAKDLDSNVNVAVDSRVDHIQCSGARKNQASVTTSINEKSRERRPLDEQFDMEALRKGVR